MIKTSKKTHKEKECHYKKMKTNPLRTKKRHTMLRNVHKMSKRDEEWPLRDVNQQNKTQNYCKEVKNKKYAHRQKV